MSSASSIIRWFRGMVDGVLGLLIWISTLANLNAGFTVQIIGPGSDRILPGQRFSVDVQLQASVGERGLNAFEADVKVDVPGLFYESIEWGAPFTGGSDDLSIPDSHSLPARLQDGVVHLSNVIDGDALFERGIVARLTFRLPADFSGDQQTTVGLNSIELLRGFESLDLEDQLSSVIRLGVPTKRVAKLLLQEETGWLGFWNVAADQVVDRGLLTPSRLEDTRWRIVGKGDFDRDGHDDIILTHHHRLIGFWKISENSVASAGFLQPETEVPAGWTLMGVADMDADLVPDLVFLHESGAIGVWLMTGFERRATRMLSVSLPADHRLLGVADVDGDGVGDLVVGTPDQGIEIWFLTSRGGLANRRSVPGSESLGAQGWRLVGVSDLDGDGQADLLLRHRDGWMGAWLLSPNNPDVRSSYLLDSVPLPVPWEVVFH